MKLVIILGPPAVGKMTVGIELARITGLRLFHNHLSLELVNRYFDFGSLAFERLDKAIRFAVFQEVAQSDLAGLIFTLVWDYDFPEDEAYIDEIIQIFEQEGAEICLVELQADLAVRLERNRQEDRLQAKPSKRDLDGSEKSLLYFESNYRMQSREGEFPDKPMLKIDNTHLSVVEVAQQIKGHFSL